MQKIQKNYEPRNLKFLTKEKAQFLKVLVFSIYILGNLKIIFKELTLPLHIVKRNSDFLKNLES